MRYIKILFLITCSSIFIACTNQEVYEAIRQNRLTECEMISPTSAYEECIEQYSESYEEYEEKRKS